MNMNGMTIGALAQRLDRVERENRMMRRGGGLLVIVVSAVVLLGQAAPPPRVVEIERLVIRDAKGTTRAILGRSEVGRGWPQWPPDPKLGKLTKPREEFGLFLYSPDGAEVSRLTDWGGEGALLALVDRQQQARVRVSAQPAPGGAQVEIASTRLPLANEIREWERLTTQAERENWSDERVRTEIASRRFTGTTSLNLMASLTADLTSTLTWQGEPGRIQLGGYGPLPPGLTFYDQQGNARIDLAIDGRSGSPRLRLMDQTGKDQAVLGQTAN
jgi:hypothetical protein